jgi:hypothetical protein
LETGSGIRSDKKKYSGPLHTVAGRHRCACLPRRRGGAQRGTSKEAEFWLEPKSATVLCEGDVHQPAHRSAHTQESSNPALRVSPSKADDNDDEE